MPVNGRERLCRFGSIIFFMLFALLAACDPPRDVSSAGTDSANQADSAQAGDRATTMIVALPQSGDVVLIGGWSKGNKSTATAEFFSQTTRKFNKLGSMAVSEAAGAAALLVDNVPHPEVLVAGGFSGSSRFIRRSVSDTIAGLAKNNLQILDPANGRFTPASSPLLTARFGATATELPSGKC